VLESADPLPPSREADAALAAAVLAVDPAGIGGVVLRSRAGPVREAWLELARALLPQGVPVLRVPTQISDDRLLGGLDLAATLATGCRIAERGILAEADGGILILPLAERFAPGAAARIAAAMDTGEVAVERDGLGRGFATRFGVIALDEGLDDERPPSVLLDRLGCHVDLEGVARAVITTPFSPADIAEAKRRLASVAVGGEAVEALCATAMALGIASLNAPYLAIKVAGAAAALAGETGVSPERVALAARLVLAPRAMVFPVEAGEAEEEPELQERELRDERQGESGTLEEMTVAAAKAAIPAGLLARLIHAGRARSSVQGRAGKREQSLRRGRPAGTRRGRLGKGARLNVVETLRAAAPWQRLRRGVQTPEQRRIAVRQDDFRIRCFSDRSESVTIFVVDASGSSALHRLAETKGAVELLLADCYVRRDQVAVLAFGGRGAQLLLPPTRSLTRAKRELADLPGGGGTPLAAALEQAVLLAHAARRKHQTPSIVVLTDGKPNLARDGRTGRKAGEEDALAAASQLRASRFAALLIDTSPQAEPSAARIASAMGAHYVPLPQADARSLSEVVRAGIGGNLP
jgi:magnesium chelatase subunit D